MTADAPSAGAASAGAASAGPDWSQVARDVTCPLCDYNLRGLVEARCPECGYRFEWERLLNPPPRHPHLFEHHPQRNAWSFVRTLVAGLLPRRFWRTLEPTYEPRPLRLVLYWFLAASLIVVGYLVLLLRFLLDPEMAFYRGMWSWTTILESTAWSSSRRRG